MRDLDWDGVPNVRDLGGLRTPLSPTGHTIMGRVARGPRRERLTAAGWAAAIEWGLRSVVDLRSEDEVGPGDTDPDPRIPDEIVITLAPTEDRTSPEFRDVCMPILDSPAYWRHNVRILPGLVRGALEAIACAEPGVLVHCAAGRDRTGMMSALLLGHAGVSSDEVFVDYARSVRAMAGTALSGGPAHDRQSAWDSDRVNAWLDDVEPHVRAFVGDPRRILDELEVEHDTRDRLRALLTRQQIIVPAQIADPVP